MQNLQEQVFRRKVEEEEILAAFNNGERLHKIKKY